MEYTYTEWVVIVTQPIEWVNTQPIVLFFAIMEWFVTQRIERFDTQPIEYIGCHSTKIPIEWVVFNQ